MALDDVLTKAGQEFEKAISHLKEQFARLQMGRASSALVENIPVEVYGSQQPVKAIANIVIPDPRTIQIQPWDRNNLAAIEKGIIGTGIGLNPMNDGVVIRIPIPPLTEERRVELTKHVHKLTEDAKISVRAARQDAHGAYKRMKDSSEITEDDWHSMDKKLQDKVDEINKKIDEIAQAKEKDVMTV
ncbi:MAG: ribosome recycling factor [Candidatus Gracilibacteria bacterium]|jgi:ribosome recycling factor